MSATPEKASSHEDPGKWADPGPIARFVPIVQWVPEYQRSWLGADLVAGFTIWGLLVPEMIAYAGLAGLPPQAGLYTILASLWLYAVFGSSKQLVVAGTSASAVLVASTVSSLHPANADDYAALAAALILLVGAIFIVSGLFRMGFIAEFMSKPVMEGFVFGLAIFVIVGQLPKILGIESPTGNTVQKFVSDLTHLAEANAATVVVGVIALAVLFGLERVAPRIPAGLVVLVLGIAASKALDLESHGVAVVGSIPAGLPSITLPSVSTSDLAALVAGAVGLVLVIFSEALGAASTFADKHGYRIDSNQDMIAIGLANIGSGLLRGLAAGGSLSQTAVNDGAGARPEASPIFASLLGFVTVLFLTALFAPLPEAILGALVIHAVWGLIKVKEMRLFYRAQPVEFWLGMTALAGVLLIDVLEGLIIGIAASLIVFIAKSTKPRVCVLGRAAGRPPGLQDYVDVARHPDAEQVPGLLLVRNVGELYFANATRVHDTVMGLARAADPAPRAVIWDLEANDDLDITSAEEIEKLVVSLRADGIDVAFANVHLPVVEAARRSGHIEAVGEDHLFATIDDAVQRYGSGAQAAAPAWIPVASAEKEGGAAP